MKSFRCMKLHNTNELIDHMDETTTWEWAL